MNAKRLADFGMHLIHEAVLDALRMKRGGRLLPRLSPDQLVFETGLPVAVVLRAITDLQDSGRILRVVGPSDFSGSAMQDSKYLLGSNESSVVDLAVKYDRLRGFVIATSEVTDSLVWDGAINPEKS